jgi:hypothetical protein
MLLVTGNTNEIADHGFGDERRRYHEKCETIAAITEHGEAARVAEYATKGRRARCTGETTVRLGGSLFSVELSDEA